MANPEPECALILLVMRLEEGAGEEPVLPMQVTSHPKISISRRDVDADASQAVLVDGLPAYMDKPARYLPYPIRLSYILRLLLTQPSIHPTKPVLSRYLSNSCAGYSTAIPADLRWMLDTRLKFTIPSKIHARRLEVLSRIARLHLALCFYTDRTLRRSIPHLRPRPGLLIQIFLSRLTPTATSTYLNAPSIEITKVTTIELVRRCTYCPDWQGIGYRTEVSLRAGHWLAEVNRMLYTKQSRIQDHKITRFKQGKGRQDESSRELRASTGSRARSFADLYPIYARAPVFSSRFSRPGSAPPQPVRAVREITTCKVANTYSKAQTPSSKSCVNCRFEDTRADPRFAKRPSAKICGSDRRDRREDDDLRVLHIFLISLSKYMYYFHDRLARSQAGVDC
ncbi:hypothetical protein FB451DRAFT_1193062 [Mycena latifolia]|nr:hypothetical protein FB451DRAFT_1193062 [Mycena latifolia]